MSANVLVLFRVVDITKIDLETLANNGLSDYFWYFQQGLTAQLMDTLTGFKVLGKNPPHLTFDHGFLIIQLSQSEEIKKTQLS